MIYDAKKRTVAVEGAASNLMKSDFYITLELISDLRSTVRDMQPSSTYYEAMSDGYEDKLLPRSWKALIPKGIQAYVGRPAGTGQPSANEDEESPVDDVALEDLQADAGDD